MIKKTLEKCPEDTGILGEKKQIFDLFLEAIEGMSNVSKVVTAKKKKKEKKSRSKAEKRLRSTKARRSLGVVLPSDNNAPTNH